jgi:hypothetical protein
VPGVTHDRPNQITDWKSSNPTLNQWFNSILPPLRRR